MFGDLPVGLFTNSNAGGNNGLIDPPFANVSLLLHMNGSNGSATFLDNSSFNHPMSSNGVVNSNTQSRFGNMAAFFTSAPSAGNNFLATASTTDLRYDVADFSIEFWAYVTANTGRNQLLVSKQTATGVTPHLVFIDANSKVVFQGWNDTGGALAYNMTGNDVVRNNEWYFIQASRNGGNFSCAMNGVVQASNVIAANTALFFSSSDRVVIGNAESAGNVGITGYMDELRLSKAFAVTFSNRSTTFPDS